MINQREYNPQRVHCRTGSLESDAARGTYSFRVHCRTGSLEIFYQMLIHPYQVHCRTGSLENQVTPFEC